MYTFFWATLCYICPLSCDERAQPWFVLLCYRNALVLLKVKLVPAVTPVQCVILMELKKLVITVEEAIDTKDEIPQAISFPLVKNEDEVWLWYICVCVCVCVWWWWQLILLGHLLAPKRNCEITLICFLLSVTLWVPCTFWNLDCKPEEERPCGSHSL